MKPLAAGMALASLFGIASHGQEPLRPGNYRVYGQGTASCGEWRRQRGDAAAGRLTRGAMEVWVVGFVSGAGYMLPATDHPMRDVDTDGLFAWLDDYCRNHPLEQLSTASGALVTELRAKR